MTDREKLVELLADKCSFRDNPCKGCECMAIAPQCREEVFGEVADHLIANGVTVREWISVEDRLPGSQVPVLVCAKDKTFGYRRVLKAAHVGHHEYSTEDYGWQEYEGDTEYDEEKDCFWIPECWYETNAVEENGNWIIDSDYIVTHWMPLPETPQKKEEPHE